MWLLDTKVRRAIEAAEKSGKHGDAPVEASAQLTTAGNVAQIDVRGVITKTPSFFAMAFGGGNTTYQGINDAIASAEADASITEIVLRIDSPGGHFDGLFSTIDAINNASKPVRAVVDGTAASAAYAIAAQADTITATNKAARIGSIGVVATYYVDEEEISVTSTEAPDKRPDVTTEEGRATVRKELDAMHAIFVEAIADGRGVTPEKINSDYGRGATVLAGEAVTLGMIDTLETATKTQPEAVRMDLNTLKAQHSAVYEAAVQDGINQERDRVGAHLTMGQKSGALGTAIDAVKNGDAMTQTLQAEYLTAGMNRADVSAKADDDAAAASAAASAAADDAQASDATDIVCQMMGVK